MELYIYMDLSTFIAFIMIACLLQYLIGKITHLLSQAFYEKPQIPQKVAEKISADRQCVLTKVPEKHSAVQESTSEQLLSSQSCILGVLYEAIYERRTAREETLENLVSLKNDVLTLQDQLRCVMPNLPKSFRRSIKKSLPSNEISVPTQAAGDSVDDLEQPEEILDAELMNCIVAVAKECFLKLVTETKNERREIIQKFSRSFEKSQKEVQKEITKICSNHFVEQYNNNNSNLRMLKNNANTVRKNNRDDIRFEMNNIGYTKIGTVWNEEHREVNTESQNIDLNKITGILKDIGQTTRELADCDRLMPDEVKHDSAQISDPADSNMLRVNLTRLRVMAQEDEPPSRYRSFNMLLWIACIIIVAFILLLAYTVRQISLSVQAISTSNISLWQSVWVAFRHEVGVLLRKLW